MKVASAIILDAQGRMLLQRRGPNREFPLCWETPGGKIEESEDYVRTLGRELQEELGLNVELVWQRPVLTLAFNPPFARKAFGQVEWCLYGCNKQTIFDHYRRGRSRHYPCSRWLVWLSAVE